MESRLKVLGHPVHPMLVMFPVALLVTGTLFDVVDTVGGPDFLAGTLQITAVNSFVQSKFCMGAAFSYRVDTADSRAFAGHFLR